MSLSANMQRRLRTELEIAESEGAEIVNVTQRKGGHMALTIRLRGGTETRKVFCSVSSSDKKRGHLNRAQTMKKVIRELREIEQ